MNTVEFVPAAAADEFEIDAEMLEVFAAEAEELLSSIEANLDKLDACPDDREALWEIKRSAHTFKGAAGIVGLTSHSEIAHRLEDLLERISERRAAANAEIFALCRKAAAGMRSVTTDPNSSPAAFAGLHAEFDRIGCAAAETPPPAHTETAPTAAAAEKRPPANAPKRPVSRVALDRLDDVTDRLRDICDGRTGFDALVSRLEHEAADLIGAAVRIKVMAADSWVADELNQLADEIIRSGSLLAASRSELAAVCERDRRSLEQAFQNARQVRLLEFGMVQPRLYGAIRASCQEVGKRVDFTIENGHIELDTLLLDSMIEPLMHILKNAVVHGIETPSERLSLGKPETGCICINLSLLNNCVVAAISDDGRGIDGDSVAAKAVDRGIVTRAAADAMSADDRVHMVFLPGLSTAETLNLSAGRGVGMSIVKESVEAKGGTIRVETEKGRGTTFTLRIPLPMANGRPQAENRAGQTGVILIVDDSPSVRHATARAVAKLGFTVETAEDGMDALEKLRNTDRLPQAILSDIEMPRADGFEMAAAIRSDRGLAHLPIVFISSRSEAPYQARAAELGAADYLIKPFSEARLSEIIRSILTATAQNYM